MAETVHFSAPVRLTEMLRCAEREVAMRRGVYPRRVRAGSMTQAEADREIRLMQDIASYLEKDLSGMF
jgi:hypothetical protein